MASNTRYVINMLIAAFIISTSSLWVKVSDVAPSVSGFYRMFIGGSLLLVICVLQKRALWYNIKHFYWLLIAALFFAFDLYFWHRSIFFIGPGLATVLGNFQVFFMAIAGYLFYKEKISLVFFVGLVVTFTGLFLLVGINWFGLTSDYKLGVLYGLLTAIAYTGFMLSMRHVQSNTQGLSAFANLGIMSMLCAFMLLGQLLVAGESIEIVTIQSMVSLLILGVFCQVVGWIIITQSMPNLPTSIVGIVLLLQPALSMVWDVLFFDRDMLFIDIIGLVMVLSGVYLATLKNSKISTN